LKHATSAVLLAAASFVDPFIGTGGHGHTFPGPTLPFGMVQLGPDTRLEGWDSCSGYHHDDTRIYGFSHTHLSGTGIPDYADVLFLPIVGPVDLAGAKPSASFDKATETARAGYYAVRLDSRIEVELTTTERAGFHRYRFPPGTPAHVIVDLEHRDRVLESALRIVSPTEIEGTRRSSSWAKDQVVHFAARFSRPWATTTDLDDSARKVALSFGDGGGELQIKVGISAVDVQGARRNLDAEIPGWEFNAVADAAAQRWTEVLGRVEVEGGTAAERTSFYTALYHALLTPNVYSDVDGRYRGMDGKIHAAQRRRQYTVFSLWDTFRAAHPLLVLLEPERTREIVDTMLAQYREGGRLPVWELAANETDTMIGYHAVSVIADAWRKGIRGFDPQAALDAMVASARGSRFGLASYQRQGFLDGQDEAESVSKTLEYAYDDACIATLAAAIGRPQIAAEFYRRSQAWRHLFDSQTQFFRPRIGQRWLEPFDPRRVDLHFTEANAWQYAFFVPQDVLGLIETLGGDGAFVARLDALFAEDSQTTGREQADITGLIGQYAHGNEPSHHVAWLYSYAGRPDRTAERVSQIRNTLYHATPDGLAGNEDCGQMSAWYVFAALGLYPASPGTDEYVVTPPIFRRIRLHLPAGQTFTIRTEGRGTYVASARLDGTETRRSFLRHEEIVRGGELRLRLGPAPGAQWGRAPADRPRSSVPGERIVPAPFVRAGAERFRGSTRVELAAGEPEATIRWTTDAAAPAESFTAYTAPIPLEHSTRIRFLAEHGGRRSSIVDAGFHRIPNDWTIALRSQPNAQYTAGGPDALVDGLRGSTEWRTGRWHGYQYVDFEAMLDLGRSRTIHRAGAGFLQDVRSWIWMPVDVVVEVSTDGESFREIAKIASEVRPESTDVVIRDLTGSFEPTEARYVRIRAKSFGTIPDWHPGHGDGAFIFVDEIE
jgi:predicted alpha-1,2-mannosidase